MTGTVKMWNERKGWGFIHPDAGGIDIFVHVSNCVDELQKGDHVRFKEGLSPRGTPAAFEVELV